MNSFKNCVAPSDTPIAVINPATVTTASVNRRNGGARNHPAIAITTHGIQTDAQTKKSAMKMEIM